MSKILNICLQNNLHKKEQIYTVNCKLLIFCAKKLGHWVEGWVEGWWSRVKDCLQQSKNTILTLNSESLYNGYPNLLVSDLQLLAIWFGDPNCLSLESSDKPNNLMFDNMKFFYIHQPKSNQILKLTLDSLTGTFIKMSQGELTLFWHLIIWPN